MLTLTYTMESKKEATSRNLMSLFLLDDIDSVLDENDIVSITMELKKESITHQTIRQVEKALEQASGQYSLLLTAISYEGEKSVVSSLNEHVKSLNDFKTESTFKRFQDASLSISKKEESSGFNKKEVEQLIQLIHHSIQKKIEEDLDELLDETEISEPSNKRSLPEKKKEDGDEDGFFSFAASLFHKLFD